MKESAIQKAVIKYLEGQGHFTFKTITCNKAGIADVISCFAGRFYAWEIKTPRGKASPIQLYQIQKIREAGGEAHVVRSVDEVKDLLNKTLT